MFGLFVDMLWDQDSREHGAISSSEAHKPLLQMRQRLRTTIALERVADGAIASECCEDRRLRERSPILRTSEPPQEDAGHIEAEPADTLSFYPNIAFHAGPLECQDFGRK